jgi:hypothetical protein
VEGSVPNEIEGVNVDQGAESRDDLIPVVDRETILLAVPLRGLIER